MVPVLLFPPVTPLTCQVTAVFEVPVTVAANCCVFCVTMLAVLGAIATVIPGVGAPLTGVTVTAAVADFVLSSVLIAVIVTARFVLTAGAV